MKKGIILGILFLGLVLTVGYQAFSQDNNFNWYNNFDNFELKQITSQDQLNEIFSNTNNNYYRGGEVFALAFDSSGPAIQESSVKVDFSQTNVQVEGIDEADLIKTDGEFIYTVSANNLFIVKAYPGDEAKVISQVKLEGSPTSLFINEDKLIVFGNYNNYEQFEFRRFMPMSSFSFIEVYDISNKENISKLTDYRVEGNYFEARMKGDEVYVFTRMYPNHQRPIPILFEKGIEREVPLNSIYYHGFNYNDPSYMNVFSLNFNDLELTSNTFIVENNANLYVSQNNIFLTHTEYINEYDVRQEAFKKVIENKLTSEDKSLISEIQRTSNNVLSANEKEAKVNEVYETAFSRLTFQEQRNLTRQTDALFEEEIEKIEYFELTMITKIGYKEGVLTPKTTGGVPGRILNQFSMDEDVQDNVFRIATTISPRWDNFGKERSLSYNNVYALDSNLKVIGSLTGLAEDERIYSTRFIGDKLYMVTFKEIDPFFVIDLSNPRNIKNLGELKIPGFSTYLHPYDETTIIGIGQEIDERGRVEGLKISLFDVSDVSNPIEVAKFVGEDRYASSTALYEHKAFLFNKERNLLVIPVFNRDWQTGYGYDGALVFSISKQDISLRGLVDHSGNSANYFGPSVERSLYIEDLLYTKSSNLIRINQISDLRSVSNVSLTRTPTLPVY
jgi:inhibitor of cysteine peptidase